MDTTCLGAALLPHPPIMLPEIGQQELKKMEATVTAVSTAASLLVERRPETLVVITPHNYVFSDSAAIFPAARIHGDLGKFGFPDLTMNVNTDMELA
ncbi:MAG TPA: AMMECR1 domain-containing protein, partial [Megasphaera sp.]|nr:AMMECR1 domain-containing protein [Megasphaera sp.]